MRLDPLKELRKKLVGGAGHLAPSLVVLVASALLLASSACKGFFVDPSLSSIQVVPAGATILIGATQQYVATGTYSDGSTSSVSSAVWSASPAASATITSSGLAKAVAAGAVTITATSGATTGTTTLTVQSAPLQSITITPANSTISMATTPTIAFTATGKNTDNTTEDVTNLATWTSSNSASVSILSTGVATPIVPNGPAVTITATYQGIIGTTTVTVKP